MNTPDSIASKRFDKQMSGYKQEEVESFLRQVAEDYGRIISEKEELENKIDVLAQQIEHYREDEDSLRNALIGAQKLGDSVIRESKAKAEYMIREAKNKSDRMMENAQKNIEKEHMALIKMQKEVTKFKNRLLTLYKQHLEMISALPDYDQDDDMMEQEEEAPRPEKQTSSFSLRKEDSMSDSKPAMQPQPEATAPAPVNVKPPEVTKEQEQPQQTSSRVLSQAEQIKQASKEEQSNYNQADSDENNINNNNGMVIDFMSAASQQENISARQEDFYQSDATREISFYPAASSQEQANDSKFGPLKFGEGFDVERDNPNKNLFSRKKHR